MRKSLVRVPQNREGIENNLKKINDGTSRDMFRDVQAFEYVHVEPATHVVAPVHPWYYF